MKKQTRKKTTATLAGDATLRMFLYRILENDDDGDPLDHGVAFAVDLDRAKKLVNLYCDEQGYLDDHGLMVRFYGLGPARTVEGIPTTKDGDTYVDVRLRAGGAKEVGLTTAEKLAAIVALLKDEQGNWRDDVSGADFIQDVTNIIDTEVR